MRIAAAALACLLLLSGCGDSESDAPAATGSPATEGVVVQIRIEDGKATPQGERVEVEIGQSVTLRITSDAAEEIHVHSDPEHTYRVGAGDEISETFSVQTPGQVAVEAHELGVTIVQLVVRP